MKIHNKGAMSVKNIKLNVILILLAVFTVACQTDEVIVFSDENFEDAIRSELNQPEGDLMESDIEEVKKLDLSNAEIEDITGLEAFMSLEKVDLKNNQIDNVAPLKELKNIEYVNLIGNKLDNKQYQRLNFLWDDGVKVITMEEADGPGGFLWEATKGETTIYLQGTIHAGPKDFYPMNNDIESAYKEADVIIPEINPEDMSQETMMNLYAELGTYQDGSTIKDHIPSELYRDLSDILNEHNMPSEIESYKPWLLSNLVDTLILQEAGYIHGVDDYFLTKAVEDDKEIKALETPEEQLAIFADTDEDYQIDLLRSSLENADNYEEEMLEMFSLYTQGDLENMKEYTATEANTDYEFYEEDQAFIEALNDERNYKMSEKISEYLDAEEDLTYLVIVGTLHLIQEPSVISILEEEGYDVEQIH